MLNIYDIPLPSKISLIGPKDFPPPDSYGKKKFDICLRYFV
jgi:hypothetical protein